MSPGTVLDGGGGFSLWQSLGALAVVFGLLVVCLKLLGRLQRRGGRQDVRILAVWPLGPRREIQVLQLENDVHTIYRFESSLVLLRQESLAQWEAGRAARQEPAGGGRLAALLQGRLTRAATPTACRPGGR